jgi:signal recognition particle receptor subunit beta
VVLVDTRRLADCFPAVDYFEQCALPYVVALNCFDGKQPYGLEDVREALQIDTSVPILLCDARDRESTKTALITLVEHTMARVYAAAGTPTAGRPGQGW